MQAAAAGAALAGAREALASSEAVAAQLQVRPTVIARPRVWEREPASERALNCATSFKPAR